MRIGHLAAICAVLISVLSWGSAMADARDKQIVRMAELEIEPAQLDAYKALLSEEIETSIRIERGVLMLNAVSLKARPSLVRILDVYADQTAYEAHLRSRDSVRG